MPTPIEAYRQNQQRRFFQIRYGMNLIMCDKRATDGERKKAEEYYLGVQAMDIATIKQAEDFLLYRR